jgi:hypothetical protein
VVMMACGFMRSLTVIVWSVPKKVVDSVIGASLRVDIRCVLFKILEGCFFEGIEYAPANMILYSWDGIFVVGCVDYALRDCCRYYFC